MNTTEEATPLIYKDMERARSELQASLKKRLSNLDNNPRLGARSRTLHGRPRGPPPPPPKKPTDGTLTDVSVSTNGKSKTLPPLPGKNQVKPELPPRPKPSIPPK